MGFGFFDCVVVLLFVLALNPNCCSTFLCCCCCYCFALLKIMVCLFFVVLVCFPLCNFHFLFYDGEMEEEETEHGELEETEGKREHRHM